MNVKTFTGKSIHAALVEARHLLGDDVILLESHPPRGSDPARITVMTDGPVPAQPSPGKENVLEPALQPTLPFGYSSPTQPKTHYQPFDHIVAEENTALAEDVTAYRTRNPSFPKPERARDNIIPKSSETLESTNHSGNRTRERGAFFPGTRAQESEVAPTLRQAGNEIYEQQLRLIHERLDKIERGFGEAMVGISLKWTTHPVFVDLLKQGLRPTTLNRIFNGISEKGIEPEAHEEALRWTLAQEMRKLLRVDVPKLTGGTQVLIGPSGSGKTSLLLKMARHPGFFGRRLTSVIVIQPEECEGIGYMNPVDLYRRFGIAVQTVSSETDIEIAVKRLNQFDQVLIDTPSLPVHEASARKMLVNLRRIIEPLTPIQVHFVLNATRSLEEFDGSFLHNLPLHPDTVALTHLDEIVGWGRVAEWMIQVGLPLQFAGTGPRVPDGLTAFSPTWFIEQMMQL